MLSLLRALPHRIAARLRHGFPRIVQVMTATILSAVLIWLFTAVNLFYYPQVSEPGQADAVVVLAGAAAERFPVGRALVRAGHAPELALSTTDTPGNLVTDLYCDYMARDTIGDDDGSGLAGTTGSAMVTCFIPTPLTTRGEARAVARLAADNGWESLIVVTSRYHLLRAETNISQCTTAKITMVASEPELSPTAWLGRFVEETGGLAAALLRPACAHRL